MIQFRMSSNSTTRMIDRVQLVVIFFIIAVVLVLAAVVGIALAFVLGPALLLLLVFGLAMLACVALAAGLLKLGVIAVEAFLHTKVAQASYSASARVGAKQHQQASRGSWATNTPQAGSRQGTRSRPGTNAEAIILGPATWRPASAPIVSYPGAARSRSAAGVSGGSVARSDLVKRLNLYVSTTATQSMEV